MIFFLVIGDMFSYGELIFFVYKMKGKKMIWGENKEGVGKVWLIGV